LGFSGKGVFKQGESTATVFVAKEKCFYPGNNAVGSGLIVNIMGTGC